MEQIIQTLAILLGGGAFGGIIVALIGKRKTDAEATNANIQGILEIDKRMHDRIVRLEERVGHLEEENTKLREENLNLKTEIQRLKHEKEKLSKD